MTPRLSAMCPLYVHTPMDTSLLRVNSSIWEGSTPHRRSWISSRSIPACLRISRSVPIGSSRPCTGTTTRRFVIDEPPTGCHPQRYVTFHSQSPDLRPGGGFSGGRTAGSTSRHQRHRQNRFSSILVKGSQRMYRISLLTRIMSCSGKMIDMSRRCSVRFYCEDRDTKKQMISL